MLRQSQRALARRALAADSMLRRSGWLHHGIAALAVSVLGLGAAASAVLTGVAQGTDATVAAPTSAGPSVESSIAPGVDQPSAFARRTEQTSRSTGRQPLAAAQRDSETTEPDLSSAEATPAPALAGAVRARARALATDSAATRKRAAALQRRAKAAAAKKRAAARAAGKATLPLTSGYRLAARFGATGSWSRYHTGFDLSAPVGTPVHTPTGGVVTTAGGGEASGWAGTYVTIKHPDGTSSLYAHMSTATVQVGQTVTAGQVIGAVGMTGRTFGAHLHFEIYPAGVEPSDVYAAVDPEPWLHKLGLKF